MGWSLADVGLTIGTGGAYGLYKAANDEINSQYDGGGVERMLYNNKLMDDAKTSAETKKANYYGTSLWGLGQESQDYANRVKSNLDKNVAKADLYNQQQGQARGLAETRAGLQGLDNTALNEGARRRSGMEAAAINENAKANALDLYGKSISNRIEGANKIENSEKALAIASMQAPETNYQPGLLGSIFGGLF